MLLFPAPGPPQLSSDKPAATTRGDTRREEGAIRYAHKMMHSPATRTTYPYPHDAASRIIIATCLVIPCLHPHLHSSIPTRHGTQFHLHTRLACGDTGVVLGFGAWLWFRSPRFHVPVPCHATFAVYLQPNTLLGRGSRHPWHPKVYLEQEEVEDVSGVLSSPWYGRVRYVYKAVCTRGRGARGAGGGTKERGSVC